jgi:hypothetical protein
MPDQTGNHQFDLRSSSRLKLAAARVNLSRPNASQSDSTDRSSIILTVKIVYLEIYLKRLLVTRRTTRIPNRISNCCQAYLDLRHGALCKSPNNDYRKCDKCRPSAVRDRKGIAQPSRSRVPLLHPTEHPRRKSKGGRYPKSAKRLGSLSHPTTGSIA